MGEDLQPFAEPQANIALEAFHLAKTAQEAGRVIITATTDVQKTLIQREDHDFDYHEVDPFGNDTLTSGAYIAGVFRKRHAFSKRRLVELTSPDEVQIGDTVLIDFRDRPDEVTLSTYMHKVTFVNRPQPRM